MADTTYTDNVTVITADTMNDLNRLHYTIFSDPADNAAAVKSLIDALTADSSPAMTDYIATEDVSAATGKKVLLSALLTALTTSANSTTGGIIPAGVMMDYGGTSAPTGWLACDGSEVSRTTYADLFTAIGTTWGAGNGTTTFNVPNMARKVSVGSGGSGTATLANSVGSTGGEETHTLTGAESGTSAHAHTASTTTTGHISASNTATGSTQYLGLDSGAFRATSTLSGEVQANFIGSSSTTVNNSSAASASSAHNNMQPSAVVLKIIKI